MGKHTKEKWIHECEKGREEERCKQQDNIMVQWGVQAGETTAGNQILYMYIVHV